MAKIFFLAFLFLGFFGISNLVAAITVGDLGVAADPGVLPTNPFYFLKEWRRGISRLFTADPVAKAELELNILNEKAAEVLKVKEALPNNIKAIKGAIANYQKAQERLRSRLELLEEFSKNPNVDRLLQQLGERVARHSWLFNTIVKDFEDQPELRVLVEKTQDKIAEIAIMAFQKTESEKFLEKLVETKKSLEMPKKETGTINEGGQ